LAAASISSGLFSIAGRQSSAVASIDGEFPDVSRSYAGNILGVEIEADVLRWQIA